MTCSSLGCAGLGQLSPLEKVFHRGQEGQYQQPVAFLSSSWTRRIERHLGMAGPGWPWREGQPWEQGGLCQEVCKHHTPNPVNSAAVAFKQVVQRMRSVWGMGS